MTKIYEDYERYDEYFLDKKGHVVHPEKKPRKKVSGGRKPGKLQSLILSIEQQFEAGKNFVELAADNPPAFYKCLYEAVRHEGFPWRFSTTDRSVFVRRTA